jgi:hypothetical protein
MAHKTDNEWKVQQENLLITVDQLEQITEVMGKVLSQVKQQINDLKEQKKTATISRDHDKKRPNKTKQNNLVH